jgi:hypothetical protein
VNSKPWNGQGWPPKSLKQKRYGESGVWERWICQLNIGQCRVREGEASSQRTLKKLSPVDGGKV